MSEVTTKPTATAGRKRRSLWEMAVFTVAMFAFGFTFPPLYRKLCELTNLNGRDPGMRIAADSVQKPDLSREVTVQFLTVVNGGREWIFKPDQSEIRVHPGQLYTVNFTAVNQLSEDVVGQAVPTITPNKAAKHLKKTECFCFNQQPFKANESKHMPVRFMLDNSLPKDIQTVTLSYTFFDVTQLAQQTSKPKG